MCVLHNAIRHWESNDPELDFVLKIPSDRQNLHGNLREDWLWMEHEPEGDELAEITIDPHRKHEAEERLRAEDKPDHLAERMWRDHTVRC